MRQVIRRIRHNMRDPGRWLCAPNYPRPLRWPAVLGDIVFGLWEHYPACCVLAYAWDTLRDRPPQATRYKQYPGLGLLVESGYVPCYRHARQTKVPRPLP